MTVAPTEELANKRPYFAPGASISGSNTASDALSEAYLARRALRPEVAQKDLSYEISSDPGLLHQYYRLREEMFISVWGLEHFSGAEDMFDKNSSFILAREGLQCVGGARITTSIRQNPHKMPMEKEDFVLGDIISELNLTNSSYCEISRLAILPDYRKGQILPEMLRRSIRWGIAEGLQYAFTLSPVPLARNYKQLGKAFGIDWRIRDDIEIPQREEYEGIKMVLSYGHLMPAKPQHVFSEKVSHSENSDVMAD